MFWSYHSIAVTLLVLIQQNLALDDERLRDLRPQPNESDLGQIHSPMLEVLMHLPSNFHYVDSSKNILRTQQYRLKRKANPKWKRNTNHSRIVHVRNYEITRPVFFVDQKNETKTMRTKRHVEPIKELKAILEKPEPEKLMSSFAGSRRLPVPDSIRGSTYTTYPVKEFDIVDVNDPEDPRRKRNDSSDDPDNSQRDKRTFLEEGTGETTTPLPFWKRKKENLPFVTGRGGSVQSGNAYTPAQHRSAENTRESHSMKNLDKTVQSNEISRSNQDNFYSATNRRTYSRQYDGFSSSTPKSVYDIIDYNHKNSPESGRIDFARNQESRRTHNEKKETPLEARPAPEPYVNRQYSYSTPWMYDKPYYQPAYPYPTEVFGRGVEYYHRTYDPGTGRIIYYANLPENGRSYDYHRHVDSINRNFYINRPFGYDPYYRNYVPPLDYRFMNTFGHSMDYLRNGRSSSQAYSNPFQEREKFPRDAKISGAFETGSKQKDDFRNKTYIIFDADERSQFSRPQYMPYNNRPAYTPAPDNIPSGSQRPFRQVPFPSIDNFPPAAFHYRNQFYSTFGPAWGFSHRSAPGVTDSNLNSKPPNSREVQLPLTMSNRGNLDKPRKT